MSRMRAFPLVSGGTLPEDVTLSFWKVGLALVALVERYTPIRARGGMSKSRNCEGLLDDSRVRRHEDGGRVGRVDQDLADGPSGERGGPRDACGHGRVDRSREVRRGRRVIDAVEADPEEAIRGSVGLARPHVEDLRVRRRQRQRADGQRHGVVEDGRPVLAPVEGPVHAALRRPDVHDVRVRGMNGDGRGATADRADRRVGLTVRYRRRADLRPERGVDLLVARLLIGQLRRALTRGL
jgi:hypothetical protein